jgi:hypothetical protein
MEELLTELWNRTYSDEGLPLGHVTVGLWEAVEGDIVTWVIRWN